MSTQFRNPLYDGRDMPDPFVRLFDGWYYLMYTTGGNVELRRSQSAAFEPQTVETRVLFTPSDNAFSNLWGPELHKVEGSWHVYFAMGTNEEASHRIYVLRTGSCGSPWQDYSFVGKVQGMPEIFSTGGTIFSAPGSGQLHLVWSSWERPHPTNGQTLNLYIARMSGPAQMAGQRVLLSRPVFPWERRGAPVNEAPAAVIKKGRVLLTYSASGSWTPDYCLGMLTLEPGADPMKVGPGGWWKSTEPVFASSPVNEVWSVGHNSFLTSPRGDEHWLVYHAKSNAEGGWAGRTARMQAFEFTKEGRPIFSEPVPLTVLTKIRQCAVEKRCGEDCCSVGEFCHEPMQQCVQFRNPIYDGRGTPDPWMAQHEGWYYLTYTTGGSVELRRSHSPTFEPNTVQSRVLWAPPQRTYGDLWAPELHYVGGAWHMYFAMGSWDRKPDGSHRMYVLRAVSAGGDPWQDYSFEGLVRGLPDIFGIDGTIFKAPGNGQLYFVYSSWDRQVVGDQNMYIMKMAGPLQVTGPRVLLSKPEYGWERKGHGINEGPAALVKDGHVFMAYSASGSWMPDYCLGMLTLEPGADPMKVGPGGWTKATQPVFGSDAGNMVWNVGHNCFLQNPATGEHWLVYHAQNHAQGGWDGRTPRLQPFTFNKEGRPALGKPWAEGDYPVDASASNASNGYQPIGRIQSYEDGLNCETDVPQALQWIDHCQQSAASPAHPMPAASPAHPMPAPSPAGGGDGAVPSTKSKVAKRVKATLKAAMEQLAVGGGEAVESDGQLPQQLPAPGGAKH